ncbi:Transposon Ty3-I Gag-Pol polyprotein [Gossypium australe]|uniref:Transposon Ty3-I Gag-Pol polyprotein n=1 Tax=Gossypium australe TaxID=47621 RepID=A0A5B6UCT7_9ROSI|nr:Transposon Ty3-I Gag-Pol polyprotein [Gossypium australe]
MATRLYMCTNHSVSKYVMKKKETKTIMMRWEFDLWIMDRKGTENQITRPDKHITPWFVNYVNYIARGVFPAQVFWQQKKRIAHE